MTAPTQRKNDCRFKLRHGSKFVPIGQSMRISHKLETGMKHEYKPHMERTASRPPVFCHASFLVFEWALELALT